MLRMCPLPDVWPRPWQGSPEQEGFVAVLRKATHIYKIRVCRLICGDFQLLPAMARLRNVIDIGYPNRARMLRRILKRRAVISADA